MLSCGFVEADLQGSRRRNKEQQAEIGALQNQCKVQQELIRELELEIIDLRADLKHARIQVCSRSNIQMSPTRYTFVTEYHEKALYRTWPNQYLSKRLIRKRCVQTQQQVHGLEQFCKAQSQDIAAYKEQLQEVSPTFAADA
jgi:hypothetical protein